MDMVEIYIAQTQERLTQVSESEIEEAVKALRQDFPNEVFELKKIG